MSSGIISAQDAFKQQDSVKFVDATYGMPGSDASPYDAYLSGRIGNAVYFDIDDIADPNRPGMHFMPDADLFAQKVGALGVSNSDTVVVYDRTGIFLAASRVWWMFKAMGHEKVYVLDGGLPAWMAEGYELTTDAPPAINFAEYSAAYKDHFSDMSDVLVAMENPTTKVVDARAEARFNGEVPEPRPGMRAGHIPNSVNLPFQNLLDSETGKLKAADQLRYIFQSLQGVDDIISSCGSGVTACVLPLAASAIGFETPIRVYDGSWSEWGDENSPTPVA